MLLQAASAGVFLHAGIKFPYFVFFNKDRGLRPKESPLCMLIAMGFLSFLCIYLGCFPEVLYNILPDSDLVKSTMPYSFYDIYIKKFGKVVTQMQMLMFSGLVFFLFLPMLKRTDTISLDFDWVYRKGCKLMYSIIDIFFNSLNKLSQKVIIEKFIGNVCRFFNQGSSRIVYGLYFIMSIATNNKEKLDRDLILKRASINVFPIGYTAMMVLIIFILVSFLTAI